MNAPTQLIRQNRLADLLIEASPCAVLLTNDGGIVVVANQTTRNWFDYSEDELIGKSIDILFEPESDCAIVSQSARQWAQMDPPVTPTIQTRMARRKDQTAFPVQLSLRPLHLDGNLSMLATVVKPSPSMPEREKSIDEERMAAVLETISGLAHESRNAMQRAQSCLDLLDLDVPRNSEASRLTESIRDALADLYRSYEDVKNYAQPIVLKRVATNLACVIEEAFDAVKDEKQRPEVELRLQCDDAFEAISMDAQRMGQVFRNLFENALDASKSSDSIDCRCLQENDSLTILIRDHGEGFNHQATGRSFEPFFTTKQRGTGLGLAVCRRVVEAHDGTISAANHPEGGVEVKMTWPASPTFNRDETGQSENVQ